MLINKENTLTFELGIDKIRLVRKTLPSPLSFLVYFHDYL
jgi:hypothetical protein